MGKWNPKFWERPKPAKANSLNQLKKGDKEKKEREWDPGEEAAQRYLQEQLERRSAEQAEKLALSLHKLEDSLSHTGESFATAGKAVAAAGIAPLAFFAGNPAPEADPEILAMCERNSDVLRAMALFTVANQAYFPYYAEGRQQQQLEPSACVSVRKVTPWESNAPGMLVQVLTKSGNVWEFYVPEGWDIFDSSWLTGALHLPEKYLVRTNVWHKIQEQEKGFSINELLASGRLRPYEDNQYKWVANHPEMGTITVESMGDTGIPLSRTEQIASNFSRNLSKEARKALGLDKGEEDK